MDTIPPLPPLPPPPVVKTATAPDSGTFGGGGHWIIGAPVVYAVLVVRHLSTGGDASGAFLWAVFLAVWATIAVLASKAGVRSSITGVGGGFILGLVAIMPFAPSKHPSPDEEAGWNPTIEKWGVQLGESLYGPALAQAAQVSDGMKQINANALALKDGKSIATQSRAQPERPQFLVKRGTLACADRQTVMLLVETENKANIALAKPDADFSDGVPDSFYAKLERDGKLVTLDKDTLMTAGSDGQYAGHRELVMAEHTRYWIATENVFSQDTPEGAFAVTFALTGEMVFRGKEGGGGRVDKQWVNLLPDLVAGLYDGTISPGTARKCVFTPNAQAGIAINALEDVTIYHARVGLEFRMPEFAVKNDGHPESILCSASAGDLRFVEMAQFTTKGGFVKMVPVFAIENTNQGK